MVEEVGSFEVMLESICDVMVVGQRVMAMFKKARKGGKAKNTFLKGKVAFYGKTEFGSGTWVGVVFDEAVGTHNGIISGTKYFSCYPKHCAFVRPNKL